METEQEAIALIEKLQRLYVKERDMEAVLELMTPDITWIGTGVDEDCSGISEASCFLEKDRQEHRDGFLLLQSHYETVPISEACCVVYGGFEAREAGDLETETLKYRISAVCVRTEEGVRLKHLHMSSPDYDQLVGNRFVKAGARKERSELRRIVEVTSEKLRKREKKLLAITRNIPGGLHICLNDRRFSLLSVSNSFLSMFGFDETEIKECFKGQFLNMVYPQDQERMRRSVKDQLLHGDEVELEYRIARKDGSVIWVLDKGMRCVEEGEEVFYCLLVDITKRKRQEEELRLSLERHEIIMDQTEDIIFEWNLQTDTMTYSANWVKKFRYEPALQHISRQLERSPNVHPEDRDGVRSMMEEVRGGKTYAEAELRIKGPSGNYIWHRVRATAQFNREGTPIKAVGVILDIDGEKKQRQLLIEQVEKDALTGLLNKKTTQARVEGILAEEAGQSFGLMIIDVDSFKNINDTFGHLCGDMVLSEAAGGLKRVFGREAVIGRVGGDEFLAFFPNPGGKEEAAAKAERVTEAFHKIKIQEKAGAIISCSMGIAFYPADEGNFKGLYKKADLALYSVKKNGKNGFEYYREDLGEALPLNLKEAGTAVGEILDSPGGGSTDDILIRYTFQMLYESVDIQTAVNRILEIVGRAYDVSRVYIFENVENDLACSNTFEWCNEGIESELPNLQKLYYHEDLADYQNNFNEEGIFYCTNIRNLGRELFDILYPQHIFSLLQCAIRDEGVFKGYVGFDECRYHRCWTREQVKTLTFIANILSTFLLKLRLKEKLKKLFPEENRREEGERDWLHNKNR